MRLVVLAVALALTVPLGAAAAPPSCERIWAALTPGADPARVAADLGTTRARVGACTKLGDRLDDLDARRAELHAARRQRGLD